MTRYVAWHRGEQRSPTEALVSSMEVERVGGHDCCRIWSRGGLAGELMLDAGDGARLATLLLVERGGGDAEEWACAHILAGFAVCARLLVRDRADLMIRLAGDPGFAIQAGRVVRTAIRARESENLTSVVEAIEALARTLDGAS